MSKINFLTVKAANALTAINANFASLAAELQNKVLYRNNPPGEPNALITDVDANGRDIYNVDRLSANEIALGGQVIDANDVILNNARFASTVRTPNLAPINPISGALPGKFLAFDSNGQPITSSGTGADTALRTDLAASSGSSLVGFTQEGTGAVIRSAQDKVREFLTPFDFGAVGGGIVDDTVAVQNAVNAAASQGKVFDGLGRLYLVGTITWPSGTIARDTRLQTRPGSVDFVAPVTIDGITTPQTRLQFTNVKVNGDRSNQTSIDPGFEDGGRHGWRIVGRVSDVLIDDCEGSYCGGDGIEIFSHNADSGVDGDYCFNNIVVRNSRFTWNRRHGGSADCFKGIRFIDCDFSNNGKDLNLVDPFTVGTRGARLGGVGQLYGRPFDIESYGVGTGWDGAWFVRCILQDCIAGFQVHEGTDDPTTPGFVPRQNLFLIGCLMNGPSATGLPFDTFSPYLGTLPVWKNIRLIDCTITLGAAVTFYLCDGASATGTQNVTVGTRSVVFVRCSNHFSLLRSNVDGTDSVFAITDDRPIPTGTTTGGVVPVPSSETWRVVKYEEDGGVVWRYNATWTPAATGLSTWQVTLPVGARMTTATGSSILTATGSPEVTSIRSTAAGFRLVNFSVIFASTGAHAIEFTIRTKGG